MRTHDTPKRRRAEADEPATDPASVTTTTTGATVDATMAGATGAAGTTAAGGGGEAEGDDAAPGIRLIADPETRRRVVMAAESDLEAARYAHWRGTVTFHDVAGAWFNMSDPNLSDHVRAEFKTIFPGLLDAFAEPRKGIITAYFCRHIRVAAALTDIGHAAGAPEGVPEAALKGPPPAGIRRLLEQDVDPAGNGHGDPRPPQTHERRQVPKRPSQLQRVLRPHLFEPHPASSSAIHIEPTFGDPEDWKAKEILFQCLHLHYKALEFLTPQPRKICMRMIFGVITTLLGTLDHRQLDRDANGLPEMPFGSNPAEVDTLERELAQANAYYEQAAQRQAQLEYLLGMVAFLVLAVVGTAVVAVTGDLLDDPVTVSILAGATGAVVSVMNRMTKGRLRLRPESGKRTIRALGFMRPAIGAIFGAVIYLFLAGGIVEVLSPPSDGSELAFYAGLGFLSGFSERFAQDVIAQATPPAPKPRATTP